MKITIEQLAEIAQNAASNHCPGITDWKDRRTHHEARIAGMKAALDAYLASFEGTPSLGQIAQQFSKDSIFTVGDLDRVRTLMLSAHAKQMEAKEAKHAKELEQLPHYDLQLRKERLYHNDSKAKLRAIAKLPEKWRIDSGLSGYCSGMQAVKDLESALSPAISPTFQTSNVVREIRETAAAINKAMNPPAEVDPYAELRKADAAGKRIKCKANKDAAWGDWQGAGGGCWHWALPPDHYEIEPTPDPLAEVKAAHERGEKIEYLNSAGEWQWCEYQPVWSKTDQYRIAPKEEWIPLGPEDVPPGSVFRRSDWLEGIHRNYAEVNVTGVWWSLGSAENPCEHWMDLMEDPWQILRPDSAAWQPCRKLKEGAK